MRRLSAWLLPLLLCPPLLIAQAAPAPQTARQALLEMFFGSAPNHLEKHLPEVTRNTFRKMSGTNGMSELDQVAMFATMAKASGAKFETFDTGPTLLHVEDPREGTKVDITVESDNLSGDEDQIEISLNITRQDKEQSLPFVPRFMFTMKTESDVWKLSEISVTIRVPLADPEFLKSIVQRHNEQSEQRAKWAIQTIVRSEAAYHLAHGTYACKLSDLSANPKQGTGSVTNGLFGDLANGKQNGYIFAISGCDGTQFRVVGEPEIPDSGGKAFCSDQSATIRASSDGKATSCLSSGEALPEPTTMLVAPQSNVALAAAAGAPQSKQLPVTPVTSESTPVSSGQPGRIRISKEVAQGNRTSSVPPVYPELARAARVQGAVVMRAVIGKSGAVQELQVVSGQPLLTQAALDAVKQWKYRPYILNGNPVEVDTQITVNFTLSN